ncbi:MAG: GCN5-related N-acetyltransferase [Actinomycetia bacterium]|nr:GCN5-related N-acetyltransferase [Actinomycetes bacterium]
MSDPTVVDDPSRSRYELLLDDHVAGTVAYLRHGDILDLVHTEIEPDHEGEGLGSAIARGVLDDVRRRGLRIRPTCPFIAGWLEKHPAYEDLIA